MTLKDLRPGESGTVTGYRGHDAPVRLMEMGLIPGTEVTVVRLAPLGDPMDLKVRGYHLSIRKREAADICVVKA
ncbi:MAG: FeoA family protein [Bacteroidota bacterium]|nr:FeoA family protein [Bacteroidota bacterium]MDE2833749.1 FeoA family protein [Bacteroidota bacterium]MDE2956819.1 FeoA family protein [Bacteroidota bacterium]